jgi:REP element-mobilizing transposase RayT
MSPLAWRFVTVNTHNSWHHGDPNGFRSRAHRIHSSGDYRNPPPPGEHAALLAYRLKQSGPCITIAAHLRERVGQAFIQQLSEQRHLVWAVSVSSDHLHAVVALPEGLKEIRTIIGHAKRKASRAVKAEMPGTVWSANGDFRRINDQAHLENCTGYVVFEQGGDSWTWHLDADEVREVVGKQRVKRGM